VSREKECKLVCEDVYGQELNQSSWPFRVSNTQSRGEGFQEVCQFGVTIIAHLAPILLLVLLHELILCYLVARQLTQEIMYTAFTVIHCVSRM
jgi:hypothetical protein